MLPPNLAGLPTPLLVEGQHLLCAYPDICACPCPTCVQARDAALSPTPTQGAHDAV